MFCVLAQSSGTRSRVYTNKAFSHADTARCSASTSPRLPNVLDIDDTEDRVHGGQQLALFNAYYGPK